MHKLDEKEKSGENEEKPSNQLDLLEESATVFVAAAVGVPRM